MNIGIILAVAAYIFWGLLPIYWKSLTGIPAQEILAHRILWAFLFLTLILAFRKGWSVFKTRLSDPGTRRLFILNTIIIGFNWYLYVWAVNSGHLVEASLGYFINPLISVVLGVFFLKERLRKTQWIAVAIAGLGVLYMTLLYGKFPWIALILAVTFGIYGLIRKIGTLNAVEGLTFETGLLFVPALGFILFIAARGTHAVGIISQAQRLLLFLSGFATTVPLILYAAAARRIPLSTLGILQFILPTLLFILGVFVYKETFPFTRFIGFSFIWTALILYIIEGLANKKRSALKQRLSPQSDLSYNPHPLERK